MSFFHSLKGSGLWNMLVKKYGGEGFISLAEEPKKEYFIMSQEDRKLIISTLFINTRETEFVMSQFILSLIKFIENNNIYALC